MQWQSGTPSRGRIIAGSGHEAPGNDLGQLGAGSGKTELCRPIPERPGTVIGPYKLLQQIGEGGFGLVYMAEQQKPVRRLVALKIIKPGMDTAEVIARFESERRRVCIMDHPNVAKVLDAGATESGHPYFVMELVKGVPITEFCDKNHLRPGEPLRLFVDICHAIQHAHHKGVIHRDIKPTNVMVSLNDGISIVKVIDFGVAKATVQKLTERTLFTAYGQMVGTPAYMSPEQAEMSGLDIDTRSDVYSLGVLLYELLTGTTPLEVERLRKAGYAEMQHMIREEESAAAEHAAFVPQKLSHDSGGKSRPGCQAAGQAAVGRPRLDRDESAGEGPEPALRDPRESGRRHRAVSRRRRNRGQASVDGLPAQEIRPAKPGNCADGRCSRRRGARGNGPGSLASRVQAYVRPTQFAGSLVVAKDLRSAKEILNRFDSSAEASIRTKEVNARLEAIGNAIKRSISWNETKDDLDLLALDLSKACRRAWEADASKLGSDTLHEFDKVIYDRAIEVTKDIAKTSRYENTGELRDKFWSLYWGELPLIETTGVSEAMVKFGDALRSWGDGTGLPPSKLADLAEEVRSACVAALAEGR